MEWDDQIEDRDPPIDEDELYDGYQVNYVASFEPDTLELARVELWGSVQGGIGIGFERCGRMRGASVCAATGPSGSWAAASATPCGSRSCWCSLDAVAEGQVAAVVRVWPWLGLTASRVVAPRSLCEQLRRIDPSWRFWLGARPRRAGGGLNRLVELDRWE